MGTKRDRGSRKGNPGEVGEAIKRKIGVYYSHNVENSINKQHIIISRLSEKFVSYGTFRNFVQGSRYIDFKNCMIILKALGVSEGDFDRYLSPCGRSDAIGVMDAVDLVNQWSGRVADWRLSNSNHPLDDLWQLAQQAQQGGFRDEMDKLLLLQAYTAHKMGEDGVRHYVGRRYEGSLLSLSQESTWVAAAANYLLGSLCLSHSVTVTEGRAKHLLPGMPEHYFGLINSVPVRVPLLLPGIAGETENFTSLSFSLDPLAGEVPRPNRYLRAHAVRMAYENIQQHDGPKASEFLAKAKRYMDAEQAERHRPLSPFRKLSITMGQMVVDLFLAEVHRTRIRKLKHNITRNFDRTYAEIERCYQSGLITEAKQLEYLASTACCEYAIQRLGHRKADIDSAFSYIRRCVERRGGLGSPVFRFDAIYRFTFSHDPSHKEEFERIIDPPNHPRPAFSNQIIS